jgi:hypothetical protein
MQRNREGVLVGYAAIAPQQATGALTSQQARINPGGRTVTPDQSPVDIDRVMEWLQSVALSLEVALETERVVGQRADHLIGLLILEGVPLGSIRDLLPDGVAESRRKLLGSGAAPGFLSAVRAGRSAQPPARPATSPQDIIGHLRGPGQRAVWQHILASARAMDGPTLFTPAGLTSELTAAGERFHMETVRTALNRLTELGGLRLSTPGQYKLTDDAVTLARVAEDTSDD